jgi:hypothetical protein
MRPPQLGERYQRDEAGARPSNDTRASKGRIFDDLGVGLSNLP